MKQVVSQLDLEMTQKAQKVKSLNGRIDTLRAEIDELKSQKEGIICPNEPPNDTELSRANDTRQAQIEVRRQKVLTLLEQGMNQNEIAELMGVSVATIKRDTKALNGKGASS